MKQSILFENGKLYVVELPEKDDLKYYPVIVPTNNPSKLKHTFNEYLYKNDTDRALANKVVVKNPEYLPVTDSLFGNKRLVLNSQPFEFKDLKDGDTFPLPADLTFDKETGMLKRIEPEKPEETQEAIMSKFSNSEIGSHHWATTLLSFIGRVGEFMNDHGCEEINHDLYKQWGASIQERVSEINNHLRSLPEFTVQRKKS